MLTLQQALSDAHVPAEAAELQGQSLARITGPMGGDGRFPPGLSASTACALNERRAATEMVRGAESPPSTSAMALR